MPRQYTVDEARKMWEDAGKEWTPAVESALRGRGQIVDDPPAPPRSYSPDLYKMERQQERMSTLGRMPERPLSASGEANIDLDHPSSAGFNFIDKALGGFVPGVDMTPDEDPDTAAMQAVGDLGAATGMLANFAGFGPAFAPIGQGVSAATRAAPIVAQSPNAARFANIVGGALQSGTQFGTYEAAHPGATPEDAAKGFNTGLGLGTLTGAPYVGKLFQNAATRVPANTAVMTGMGVAEGQPVGEALRHAIPYAVAFEGGHLASPSPPSAVANPRRPYRSDMLQGPAAGVEAPAAPKSEAPAAPEVPKPEAGKQRLKDAVSWNKDYWKNWAESTTDPVDNNPMTKPFSEYAKGEIELKDIPSRLKSVGAMLDPVAKVPKDRADALKYYEERLPRELVKDVKEGRIKDIDPSTLADPNLQIEGIGGRAHNSPLVKYVQRANDLVDVSMMKAGEDLRIRLNELKDRHGISSKPDREVLGRLLNLYKSGPGDPLIGRADQAKALFSRASDPAGMRAALKDARPLLEEWHGVMNEADLAYGGNGVGHIDAYFPKQAKGPRWWQLGEKARRLGAQEGREDPGMNSRRDDKFVSSKQRRKSTDPEKVILDGREVPREWDFDIVMDRYVDDVINSIASQAAIRNGAHVVKYLELAGKPKAARSINRTIQHIYNNEPAGIGGALDARLDTGVKGRVAKSILTKNKVLFDRSHYGFNPRFTFGTQWTSLIPQIATHPAAAVKALPNLLNPAAWDAMLSTTTSRAKRGRGRGVTHQAEGKLYGGERLVKGGKARRVGRTFMEGMSNAMEDFTQVFGGLIAEKSKTASGLKGRDRSDYVSVQQQKWQSRYDKRGRAPMLNSRVIQGTNPAQSYNVEVLNRIRETAGKSLGIDSGKSQAAKNAKAGYTYGVIVMSSLVRAALFGYGGWEVIDVLKGLLGQVPLGQLVHGLGPSGGKTLNASDVGRAIRLGFDLADGEFLDAGKEAGRWVPGGTFGADVIREVEGEGPYSEAYKNMMELFESLGEEDSSPRKR